MKRRIPSVAFALALSLLVHVALLFGPKLVVLAPIEAPIPQLAARLEPIPVVKPAPKSHPKKQTKPAPRPAAPSPLPAEPSADEPATEEIPVAEEIQPAAPEVIPEVAIPEKVKPAHPLPGRAQLTFIAYKGTSFQVGEARHKLEISKDGRYVLQVGMNTTGIASFFKTFELNQQSLGTVSAHGLRPDEFTETKATSKGKQTLTARFDWDNKQLAFSAGNTSALPEGAQDLLSFLYQFSQMQLDQATLPMHVSNGRKLENYQVEVGEGEEIQTRLGKLKALPLRKIHAPGEEGLEIWLGLEYRLLPVKVRQIDRNGEIAGELVISDIRVSDDGM